MSVVVAVVPIFRKVNPSVSGDSHTQETAHHGVEYGIAENVRSSDELRDGGIAVSRYRRAGVNGDQEWEERLRSREESRQCTVHLADQPSEHSGTAAQRHSGGRERERERYAEGKRGGYTKILNLPPCAGKPVP